MSFDVKDKLDNARDKLGNLYIAYSNMQNGHRFDREFTSFMAEVAEFFTDYANDVLVAMDAAIDHIAYLDEQVEDSEDEIEDLREQVGQLEKTISEYEEETE